MPSNSKRFSNTTHSAVLSNTSIARRPLHAPHVAKGGAGSNLTEKEKIARRQSRMLRTANFDGGFSVNPVGGANTNLSGTGSFFSPQLSTDFLELPQSLRERREIFTHFYNSDPIVGQAIDLHTELPLSKVRLATPKPRTCPEGFKDPQSYGKYILTFFEKMCKRIKLFQRLITATHEVLLQGNAILFAEDSTVDVPESVGYNVQKVKQATLTDEGDAVETEETVAEELPDREDRELAFYQKHYQGWDRLVIIPIDQVKITTYDFTDKVRLELIPTDRTRALIEQAKAGDEVAAEMVAEMPAEVREHIELGKLIPLGLDPDEGSFAYHLAGRKGAADELGHSILERCLRTLYYREKLRQAQTQIASRAMTPKRIVWAEGLSDVDTEELREQVDLALVDPDYSIVTNYELHWEEMGSKDRLLDLSTEYEITDKQLFAGLGVTESLLNGESTFAGDRLKLEVINTRYMLYREIIQEYVEEYLFKPIARRKGFIETDEWGDEVVLFPKLSFTRLALRDSQDTYDALFNLYQKGSISIDVILELFNIDPSDTKEKIERDMFTVNDAVFNEVMRGIYSAVGQKVADESDVMQKICDYLKLTVKAPPAEPEESRF